MKINSKKTNQFPFKKVQIAVLVATSNRPELLMNRSLPSIKNQTRAPDWLIIVDDSDKKNRQLNKQIAAYFDLSNTKVVYLDNYRTDGASGAWNTGLDWITRKCEKPESVFIAILDDDDEWEPEYLEKCLETAIAGNHQIVAAGINRHEEHGKPPRQQWIPDKLDQNEILIRSPHIQGSNLFVRLDVILKAGLFDESLKAVTDRDMLIRITDLCDVSYGPVNFHGVHHHAEPTPEPRLSTRGGKKRKDGLTEFYRKYECRMDKKTRSHSLSRAKQLFDWEPSKDKSTEETVCEILTDINPSPVNLIIGIVADNSHLDRLCNLLEDILILSYDEYICGMDVVVLENGKRSKREIRELVEQFRSKGLRCYLITISDQKKDAKRNLFGQGFSREKEKISTGKARTMLQMYVHLLAEEKRDSVAWILDDDKRLDAFLSINGKIQKNNVPFAKYIAMLKENDFDVVIGIDTDSPPLPFSSTIRTQMVDLIHNLNMLSRHSPDSRLPDLGHENARKRQHWREYYYDLSRIETDHLESPFWIVPEYSEETVKEAFTRICKRLVRILAGEQVFRPLAISRLAINLMPIPSVKRGGNTIVFNTDALKDTPNINAVISGREVRRSDMNWALINVFRYCRKVVQVALPVRHCRDDVKVNGLDFEKLEDDIRGYACYSSLEDLLAKRRETRQQKNTLEMDNLDFDDEDVEYAINKYEKYIDERLSAFRLSFYRITGLVDSIKRFLDPSKTPWAWWHYDNSVNSSIVSLRDFLVMMEKEYQMGKLQRLRSNLLNIDKHEVRLFFSEIRGKLERFTERSKTNKDAAIKRLESQRIEISRIQIERLTRAGSLQLLGHGKEGVIFADGSEVYKYLDYWKAVDSVERRTFLKNLVGKWQNTKALYPILEFRAEGPHAVLVYPYEEGEEYRGGHGAGLVRLLQECLENGVVCRNIHPSNMIVTRTGLRLIDYGSDIRPYNRQEFEHMCKRVWLSWRWHHLRDLKSIMTKALINDELPWLDGWERLRDVVSIRGKEQCLDDLLEEKLAREEGTVLDYGCGKGKMVIRLARRGIKVTGYDPDQELVKRWYSMDSEARFGGEELLADLRRNGEKFDTVICNLVLCTIEDRNEYMRILQDIALFTKTGGKAVIAVCNPFYTIGGNTSLQNRFLPDNHSGDRVFSWSKTVKSTGSHLDDVHRPLDRLRRDLLQAGLSISNITETEALDTDRFEPSSDFLILETKLLDDVDHYVSLVIKASFMEGTTIEKQVSHIVKQLEDPAFFRERILIVDSRKDNFQRQYTEPDEEAFEESVRNLLQRGIITAIVRGPKDSNYISDLYKRWFDIEAEDTHSSNGTQLASTLAGFEACSCKYILQVDSDIMVLRADRTHDYLKEMIGVIESDPNALTVSFNIFNRHKRPYTSAGPNGDWRVEVRASLFDRERLLFARPLPNEIDGKCLIKAWHRAIDEKICVSKWKSYRGGDPRTCYIHPPNYRKKDMSKWMLILNRVEQGFVPDDQNDQVDLACDLQRWMEPKRSEPFIFLICGHNVYPGRFRRCIDSIKMQSYSNWGAIIIDDCSEPWISEYIQFACQAFMDKVTLIQTRLHRGKILNTILAIRNICSNPESVIITLDADDALLTTAALERIALEYSRGADATVGSMLRTDKDVKYKVDFNNPRRNGKSNIWLHPRTFKKYLFDRIPDSYLRVDGRYPPVANDWAIMTSIIELSLRPVFIEDLIYLHEPSIKRKSSYRLMREKTISAVLAKEPIQSEV